MKQGKWRMLALAAIMAWGRGAVLAGDRKPDIGQREYESNCAACHGVSGKGDGPVAEVLKVRVPDLTQLSRNNGGVFPFGRVYESIDGRQQLQSHGTPNMPVWGNAYRAAGSPDYDDYPFASEYFVRSRILALIEYLHRIQAK